MASLYLSIMSSGLRQFLARPISALVSGLMPLVVRAPAGRERENSLLLFPSCSPTTFKRNVQEMKPKCMPRKSKPGESLQVIRGLYRQHRLQG